MMEEAHKELSLHITIDENDIVNGATKIIKEIRPTWPIEQLNFKLFTNGITNKLIGVWYPGHYNDMVLVRVYGQKTDLLIDRKAETRNIRILHKAGYTHSIYATFNNGLAYEFLQGDTLKPESVRQPKIYYLIAKRMAEMHRLNPEHPDIPREPMIWSKTEQFMRLMPRSFSDPEKQSKFETLIQPYTVLEKEYLLLKDHLSMLNDFVVYAHNDLLLGNILYNEKEETVTFIDYEYTAYNYRSFDIANHFAEFAGLDTPNYSFYPEESLQRKWLEVYLKVYNGSNNVSDNDVSKLYIHVNKFVLMSHFFWGCWSLIQSHYSNIEFDFLEYAAVRFNEYFRRKEEFPTLQLKNSL